jgi:hypothetical protein
MKVLALLVPIDGKGFRSRARYPGESPARSQLGLFARSSGVQQEPQDDAGGKRNTIAAYLNQIMPTFTWMRSAIFVSRTFVMRLLPA